LLSSAKARDRLVRLLRAAHSGERAAYHAYVGHWRSVADPEQLAAIKRIAAEELEHRREVGQMLAGLGAAPSAWREPVFLLIGVTIGWLCRLGSWFGRLGWYAGMDGAGRIEARNVHEYVTAAELAQAAGQEALIPSLQAMAVVEWEHEVYFYERCQSSRLSRWAPGWRRPTRPRSDSDATGGSFPHGARVGARLPE